MHQVDQVQAACEFIKPYIDGEVTWGIILGSGLGNLVAQVEVIKVLPFQMIPNFQLTTVAGHAGELIIGRLSGHLVLILNGRIHAYEGYTQGVVSFPVRVLKALGVRQLIISNACGGMRPELYLGALVMIEDHLNLTFMNPLNGNQLIDMTYAYDKQLLSLAEQAAKRIDMKIHKGIYGAISGPSYMTKAELKALRRLGADVVGMSIVPEVVVAKQCELRVIAISCVTDMSIPESLEPLDHEMVVRVAKQTNPKFTQFVTALLNEVNVNENV